MVKNGLKPGEPGESTAPSRILAAARQEFVEKGFSAARMQAIAKSAGVNHALLHYYFGSKEKLYDEALREILTTVWGGLWGEMKSLPPDCEFKDLLRTLLKAHARIITGHPGFLPFILREVMGESRMKPQLMAEILQTYGEVPRRLNAALLHEITVGRLRPISPLNFWMNLVGMAAGGFIASKVLKRFQASAAPHFAAFEFTEAFFLERAEMIAAVLIQGLRPEHAECE